jgi:hypothetical protein
LTSSDRLVSLHVPSVGTPKLMKTEGGYLLEVPLGASIPASCTLWPSQIDAAAVMRNIVALTEKMTAHGLGEVDAGIFGSSPYLYSETMYRAEKDGKPLVGELKAYVVMMDQIGFACIHDEVGYRKSLEAVALSLANSFTVQGIDPPSVRFREISIAAFNGKRIGFDETRLADRKGGGTVYLAISATLMPASMTEFNATDAVTVEETNARSQIVSGKYISVDKIKEYEISLQRKNARLVIDGTYHGKTIHAEVSDRGLVDSAHRAAFLRKKLLGSGANGKLTFDEYTPAVNPVALTSVEIRRITQPAGFAFAEKVGELELLENLDEAGHTREAELDLAGKKMSFKRVLIDGKAP